jgi:hypothetical protein
MHEREYEKVEKRGETRPSSLAENGGDRSSKTAGGAVKVVKMSGYGTPVKSGRRRYTE